MGPKRSRQSKHRSELTKKSKIWLKRRCISTMTIDTTTMTSGIVGTRAKDVPTTSTQVYPTFSTLKKVSQMVASPEKTLMTLRSGKKIFFQEAGSPTPSTSGLLLSPLIASPGSSVNQKRTKPKNLRSLPMRNDIDVGFVKEELHSSMDEMAISDEDQNNVNMQSGKHSLAMKNEIDEGCVVKEEPHYYDDEKAVCNQEMKNEIINS